MDEARLDEQVARRELENQRQKRLSAEVVLLTACAFLAGNRRTSVAGVLS